jgi:hypothetical protein
MSCSSRSFRLFCFLPLLISIVIKLPKMNDSSLLAASVQEVQAAKKGVSLPTSLEGAAISDVIVQDVIDKVTQEALLDDHDRILVANLMTISWCQRKNDRTSAWKKAKLNVICTWKNCS